jgi:hypothetical protein
MVEGSVCIGLRAIVDVIEKPASGAIVVTEAEATEVREPSAGPEQPTGRNESEES